MRADPIVDSSVMGVLNIYAIAFEKRDIERIVSLFSPDGDLITIGLGADEKKTGLAELTRQIKKEASRSEKSSIEFTWHMVSSSGNVAWVAADVIMHEKYDGEEVDYPLRLTAVMEQRGPRWLISQMHKSLPAAI